MDESEDSEGDDAALSKAATVGMPKPPPRGQHTPAQGEPSALWEHQLYATEAKLPVRVFTEHVISGAAYKVVLLTTKTTALEAMQEAVHKLRTIRGDFALQSRNNEGVKTLDGNECLLPFLERHRETQLFLLALTPPQMTQKIYLRFTVAHLDAELAVATKMIDADPSVRIDALIDRAASKFRIGGEVALSVAIPGRKGEIRLDSTKGLMEELEAKGIGMDEVGRSEFRLTRALNTSAPPSPAVDRKFSLIFGDRRSSSSTSVSADNGGSSPRSSFIKSNSIDFSKQSSSKQEVSSGNLSNSRSPPLSSGSLAVNGTLTTSNGSLAPSSISGLTKQSSPSTSLSNLTTDNGSVSSSPKLGVNNQRNLQTNTSNSNLSSVGSPAAKPLQIVTNQPTVSGSSSSNMNAASSTAPRSTSTPHGITASGNQTTSGTVVSPFANASSTSAVSSPFSSMGNSAKNSSSTSNANNSAVSALLGSTTSNSIASASASGSDMVKGLNSVSTNASASTKPSSEPTKALLMPATPASAEKSLSPEEIRRFSSRTEQMWAETEDLIAATLKDLQEFQ